MADAVGRQLPTVRVQANSWDLDSPTAQTLQAPAGAELGAASAESGHLDAPQHLESSGDAQLPVEGE